MRLRFFDMAGPQLRGGWIGQDKPPAYADASADLAQAQVSLQRPYVLSTGTRIQRIRGWEVDSTDRRHRGGEERRGFELPLL